MTIKYLKKASKTASTDDTKTKDIVQNLLKELDKFLNFEDEIILNFYNHNIIEQNIDNNQVSKIFKDFKI